MPLETQVPDGNNSILKHNVIHVMCNHKFCMAKGKITLKMPLETQVIIYNQLLLLTLHYVTSTFFSDFFVFVFLFFLFHLSFLPLSASTFSKVPHIIIDYLFQISTKSLLIEERHEGHDRKLTSIKINILYARKKNEALQLGRPRTYLKATKIYLQFY